MPLAHESTTYICDISAQVHLRNIGPSTVEVTDYFIGGYQSVGVRLKVEPGASQVLIVQTYVLEKGRNYSVLIKTSRGELEGPFKITA